MFSSAWCQINESRKEHTKPFDIVAWGREDDMPVKAGDLVSIEGGLVSAGASPTIKLAGGKPVYTNCRTTNRFSHFDSTGKLGTRKCASTPAATSSSPWQR